MLRRPGRAAFSLLLLLLLVGAPGLARAEQPLDSDTKAIEELLHGPKGRREVWTHAPTLVVLTSVLQYSGTDMASGYVATSEQLTTEELVRLTADLTEALDVLTGGAFKSFARIHHESVTNGHKARVLRKGQIVVARYRGVRAAANTVGYGGRTTRGDGSITAAAIILDRDFDKHNDMRDLLRTHELGHALGYNHVESRTSIMNPRVGSVVTEFDRSAVRLAFQESAE
jgi:hypothetical protein